MSFGVDLWFSILPMAQCKDKRSEVLTAMNMKITVFWDVMPGNMEERYECFRGTYCLHFQARGVSSTLKTKATGSSEMLVHVYQTTRCHIPEDHNCHVKMTLALK
jgi:hypothetical protein